MSIPARPARADRRTQRLVVGLAVAGVVAVLLAGLLPWRDDGLSEADPLLEVARRAPAVLAC